MFKRLSRKCYISGPITGVEDFLERFNKCENDFKQRYGWEVVNPARVNSALPKSTSYSEYMEMSMTMMRMCDCIFMMQGWETSAGAKFERQYAIIRGMDIFEEKENGEVVLVSVT